MVERQLPPLVDPKELLVKNFERIQVGLLAEEPSPELLRWTTTLQDESGFVYQKPNWFVIKASELGVPAYVMPRDSDILMHTHPEGRCHRDHTLPSTNDFLNASDMAINLIASAIRITRFWPVDGELRKLLEFITHRGMLTISTEAYIELLRENGAKYEVHPWGELGQNKLSEYFN
ncbi:hypothetical protein A2Z54_02070 [Candidatus Curtissbacteria bacterium RIFCSPHIGHO2_02_39_8]|nr:MAG: hypothetical protein A2Z54_02070 [Candidatus Curtissbacteria bacterium RIFCSPHIGHO2_02_39_8]